MHSLHSATLDGHPVIATIGNPWSLLTQQILPDHAVVVVGFEFVPGIEEVVYMDPATERSNGCRWTGFSSAGAFPERSVHRPVGPQRDHPARRGRGQLLPLPGRYPRCRPHYPAATRLTAKRACDKADLMGRSKEGDKPSGACAAGTGGFGVTRGHEHQQSKLLPSLPEHVPGPRRLERALALFDLLGVQCQTMSIPFNEASIPGRHT